MRYFMVFDVESAGLHGEGFAAGFVVVDEQGKVHEEMLLVAPVPSIIDLDTILWIQQNVPQMPTGYKLAEEMRWRFWGEWEKWQEKGATLWADCCWPVETNFLTECIFDDFANRKQKGPYPLCDIATLAVACGIDPTATQARLSNELPPHNPLNDARQSARLLLQYLRQLGAI